MKKEKELKELDELTKDELIKVSNVKSILSQIGKLSREERIDLFKQFETLYWEEGSKFSAGVEFDSTQYNKE